MSTTRRTTLADLRWITLAAEREAGELDNLPWRSPAAA
jgi:hypothetical protein